MLFKLTRKAAIAFFLAVFKLAVWFDHAYDFCDDAKHAWHAVVMMFSVQLTAPANGRKSVSAEKKRAACWVRALLIRVVASLRFGRNACSQLFALA